MLYPPALFSFIHIDVIKNAKAVFQFNRYCSNVPAQLTGKTIQSSLSVLLLFFS